MANIMNVIPKTLSDAIKKYYHDLYDGKIPITCDEDCDEDCSGDHGNYELPDTFEPLFEEVKEN